MAEQFPGGDLNPSPDSYPQAQEPTRTHGQRYKSDGDHFIRMEMEALTIGPTGPTGATGPTGPTGEVFQSGIIQMYAGATAPAGWLLCNGQTLNTSTNPEYTNLYNAISTTYGGSGPTNFQLPSFPARFPRGAASFNTPSVVSNAARSSGTTYNASTGNEGAHTHTWACTISGGTTNDVNYYHSHGVGQNDHGHGWNMDGTGGNSSTNGGTVNFTGIDAAGHGHTTSSGNAMGNSGIAFTNAYHYHNCAANSNTEGGTASVGTAHSHVYTLPISQLLYVIKI